MQLYLTFWLRQWRVSGHTRAAVSSLQYMRKYRYILSNYIRRQRLHIQQSNIKMGKGGNEDVR